MKRKGGTNSQTKGRDGTRISKSRTLALSPVSGTILAAEWMHRCDEDTVINETA